MTLPLGELADRFGGVVPVYLKLPPEQIVRLKFLVESYEGIGVARTLNPERGEVVILATLSTAAIVMELLDNLKEELGIRILELPDNAQEDWLLG